jgi:hypothetical protein
LLAATGSPSEPGDEGKRTGGRGDPHHLEGDAPSCAHVRDREHENSRAARGERKPEERAGACKNDLSPADSGCPLRRPVAELGGEEQSGRVERCARVDATLPQEQGACVRRGEKRKPPREEVVPAPDNGNTEHGRSEHAEREQLLLELACRRGGPDRQGERSDDCGTA